MGLSFLQPQRSTVTPWDKPVAGRAPHLPWQLAVLPGAHFTALSQVIAERAAALCRAPEAAVVARERGPGREGSDPELIQLLGPAPWAPALCCPQDPAGCVPFPSGRGAGLNSRLRSSDAMDSFSFDSWSKWGPNGRPSLRALCTQGPEPPLHQASYVSGQPSGRW